MQALGSTGSGGSLDAVIQRLMLLERQPLDKLLLRRTEIESQKSAVSTLSSLLSTLQTKATTLSSRAGISPLYRFKAETSDSDRITATAGPGALVGSYAVSVDRLAAAHSMASSEFVLDAESFAAGDYAFDISVGETTVPIEISVAEGDDNAAVMRRIADALNDSEAGVVASMTTTNEAGGAGKLIVRSGESGTANAIGSIVDVSGDLAATLGLGTVQEAADAVLWVDGVQVTASSNTVQGALPGVTLHLVSVTQAENAPPAPVTIDVTGDRAAVKAALDDFIAAYNNAVTEVRATTRDALRGDPIIAGLPTLMSRAVARRVEALGEEAPSTLLELGISFEADGTLALSNVARLNETLDQHGVDAVAAIFNQASELEEEQGLAQRLDVLLGQFLGGPKPVGGYDLAGPLGLLEQQLQARDERLDTRVEREEERLMHYESALRRRYARIQDLISAVVAQNNVASNLFSSVFGAPM